MTTMQGMQGVGLYLRHYDEKQHGTPRELAKRFADHKLSWVAIGGPWHELRDDGHVSTKFMNTPSVCKALSYAFYNVDVEPFIWGYPWQGTEEKFADQMDECAGEFNLALLDPELGSNPTRTSKGAGKLAANRHAALLIKLMAERFEGGWCGLSTFGSGVRMGWFPLYAFMKALALHFPKRSFAGGQTYTDDGVIDRSIADFVKAINANGGLDTIQLVPNFGVYTRVNGHLRSKTPLELRAHLYEFINEGEPVHAVIGWAENFAKPELWKVLAEFADLLGRGAGCL